MRLSDIIEGKKCYLVRDRWKGRSALAGQSSFLIHSKGSSSADLKPIEIASTHIKLPRCPKPKTRDTAKLKKARFRVINNTSHDQEIGKFKKLIHTTSAMLARDDLQGWDAVGADFD
jgi:hypothetical protein